MHFSISKTLALVLVAITLISTGDRYVYAWLESGPAPACTTPPAAVLADNWHRL